MLRRTPTGGSRRPAIDRTVDATHDFDPTTTDTTFRIALSELGEIGWLADIAADLTSQAPGARLEVERLAPDGVADALVRGAVDLAITPAVLGRGLDHILIKTEAYRVAMRAEHPLAGAALTLADYRTAARVAVAGDSSAPRLEAEHQLLAAGSPALTIQGFAALPHVLRRNDLVAAIPETFATGWERGWQLTSQALPFPFAPVSLHLYRRASPSYVHALDWFQRTVSRSVGRSRGRFSTIGAEPSDWRPVGRGSVTAGPARGRPTSTPGCPRPRRSRR